MRSARTASAALWALASGAALVADLHPPSVQAARGIALAGAFWMAICDYLRRGGSTEMGPRFVAGLVLAAASAHLGWAFLHLDDVLVHARTLLNPTVGHSVLFAPLGVLALVPRQRTVRERYLAAALGSLPQAFAVARVGCIAGGCCGGMAGVFGTHPTRFYEIAGLLGLARWTRSLPRAWVAPATLSGFGTLRLVTEPFRAAPPLGEPLIAPTALGIGWIAVGSAMAVVALQRPCPEAGQP
jgi:hypothetical protein